MSIPELSRIDDILNSQPTTNQTILVVEDDRTLSEAVCLYLTKHGYCCIPISHGLRATSHLAGVDLILLDLNLPDTDGLQVLRQVRQQSRVPVMIVSGRGEGCQRILGLDLGADDYLVKPILPGELLARVKALLRRRRGKDEETDDGLVFDERARMVRGIGTQVSLTEQEFELLKIMAESPEQTFTRGELLSLIWREGRAKRTRRVDLVVSRIRTKFIEQQLEPPIDSVWKVGYRFKPVEEAT